jgi:hypothetical protein
VVAVALLTTLMLLAVAARASAQAPTTTTVSCASPGGGAIVQSESPTACTAEVAPTGSASLRPTGTVSFSATSGSFDQTTCTLAVDTSRTSSGSSCSVNFTPGIVGSTPTVSADYGGDGSFQPSSGSSPQLVVDDPMTVLCSPAPLTPFTTTTCTLIVGDFSAAPSDPQVTVGFRSDSIPICLTPPSDEPCPLQGGEFFSAFYGGATCVLTPYQANESSCSVTYEALRPGVQTITSTTQQGSPPVTGGAVTPLDVVPRPTAMAVSCIPVLAVAGSPETCSASVSDVGAAGDFPGSPLGTVSLASSGIGSLSAGSCALQPEGVDASVCAVSYTAPAAGSATVTAAYGGDDIFSGSVGSGGMAFISPTPAFIPAPAPSPPAPSRPSNAFSFGKLKLNTKSGSATIAITVPDAGKLVVSGPGFSQTKTSRGRATFTFTISAKGSALATLRRKHKVSITLHVSFTPNGGTKLTRAKSITLTRK